MTQGYLYLLNFIFLRFTPGNSLATQLFIHTTLNSQYSPHQGNKHASSQPSIKTALLPISSQSIQLLNQEHLNSDNFPTWKLSGRATFTTEAWKISIQKILHPDNLSLIRKPIHEILRQTTYQISVRQISINKILKGGNSLYQCFRSWLSSNPTAKTGHNIWFMSLWHATCNIFGLFDLSILNI